MRYLQNLIRVGRIGRQTIYVDPRNRHEVKNLIQRDIPQGEGTFTCPNPAPRILDCGAHVGVMTTHLKMQHPHASIISFEPNPSSYTKLLDNIEGNGFRDITTINAALSDFDGKAVLFGAEEDETRGNSISQAWGDRNEHSTQMHTQVTRLSHFLRRPCDFLKLDVEGVEYKVLLECGAWLQNCREIELEIHITASCGFTVQDIELLLLRQGFQITAKKSRDISATLPKKWDSWTEHAKPHLTVIRAFNPLYDSRYPAKPRG